MSAVEEGFGGALDMSGANTEGFKALDPGTYDCELFEYKWAATKGGPDAKLPEGTPLLKITFKCIEPELETRRFWTQYSIPPDDYDAEKRATALGFLARFLMALGLSEDEAKDKKLKLNDILDDKIGHPVAVTVNVERQKQGARKGEDINTVVGVKAMEEETAGSGKLL